LFQHRLVAKIPTNITTLFLSGKQLLFQLRGSDAARRGGRAHQALSNPFLTHSSHN